MDSAPSRKLQFTFTHVPPVMKRGRHTLIMVIDEQGKFVLGAKDIYPPGIVRFVGGGLEGTEDPKLGAARELQEELGILVHPSALQSVATIIAQIDEESTGKHFDFTTYLYALRADSQDILADDDLDGLKHLTIKEMETLIETYAALPDDLITIPSKNPLIPEEEVFRWSDYGKLYGEIHRIGLESVVKGEYYGR